MDNAFACSPGAWVRFPPLAKANKCIVMTVFLPLSVMWQVTGIEPGTISIIQHLHVILMLIILLDTTSMGEHGISVRNGKQPDFIVANNVTGSGSASSQPYNLDPAQSMLSLQLKCTFSVLCTLIKIYLGSCLGYEVTIQFL